MIDIRRILVPIDFSEFSDLALFYGREFADKYDAELHLLHVLEVHLSGTPQFVMGIAIPERIEESIDLVQKKLDETTADDAQAGRNIVTATGHGSPFVEILRYANEQNVDVIVIGTHGRTGLKHVLLGSVAENVVRHAPCPVLTVRPQGHQFVAP